MNKIRIIGTFQTREMACFDRTKADNVSKQNLSPIPSVSSSIFCINRHDLLISSNDGKNEIGGN